MEQLDRKQAAKKLLEEEEAELGGKSMVGRATKVTRSQIEETQAQQRRESGATASALAKGVTEDRWQLENPNHLLRQQQMEGEIDARTVDEAISVLSVTKERPDMHPEKRAKAAYATFEERELPRLKAENPNLRMSQLKQLLRKDWMKSPENPLNEHLAGSS